MAYDQLKKSAIKSVKLTTFSTVLTGLIGIIQLIVIGRIIGPASFGLFAMVNLVIQFSTIFLTMGLTDAIIQRKENSKLSLSSLYWFNQLLGWILFIIVVISAPLIATFFNEDILTDMIRAVAFVFLVTPLFIQFETIARKSMKFELIAVTEISSAFINLVVSLILAIFFGAGVWALVIGYVCGIVLKALIWIIVELRRKVNLPIYKFSFDSIKTYMSFGLYRAGGGIANYFSSKVDQIIVGYIFGPSVLGLYSMAMNLAMQPSQKINPIVTKISLPYFSKIQGDRQELKSQYLLMMKLITLINAPIFLGLAAVSPVAVPVLLGAEWSNSIIILQVLSIYVLIRAYGNASGTLIVACGQAKWSFYWNVMIMFIVPPVVFLSAQLGDILYVSTAMVILQILLFFMNYYLRIIKLIGQSLIEFFVTVKYIYLSSFIMFIPIFVFNYHLTYSGTLPLIIFILVGGTIYIAMMFIFEKNFVIKCKRLAIN